MCVCVLWGVSAVCPLQETKKETKTHLRGPATKRYPSKHPLLPRSPLTSTHGRSYSASSWGVRKRVSSGRSGRDEDTYQSAVNGHHKAPPSFFSHNCPPTFITWKSQQRGRPRPTFMWFGWRRNEREENEKLRLFFPDKDKKICCAGGGSIGGVWTEKHGPV